MTTEKLTTMAIGSNRGLRSISAHNTAVSRLQRALNTTRKRFNLTTIAFVLAATPFLSTCSQTNGARIEVLADAILKDDSSAFRAEFNKGFDGKAFNSVDRRLKLTIVHVAAMKGENEILAILLDSGVKVDLRTSEESTPLFSAACFGRAETVKFLLSRGADANAVGNVSLGKTFGSTPLTIASFGGHIDTIKALLDGGADINGLAATMPPVVAAAINDHYETVEFLLSKGARVDMKTPKMIAEKGNARVAALLWDKLCNEPMMTLIGFPAYDKTVLELRELAACPMPAKRPRPPSW
jgi:hypothetical protein